nr:hypothetical protein CFP56_35071 [Quercus suber]
MQLNGTFIKECSRGYSTGKHGCGARGAAPASDTANRASVPRRVASCHVAKPTRADAAQIGPTQAVSTIHADSGQNGPIPAEMESDTDDMATETCRFRPKRPPKQADTADSGRNRTKWAVAAILLLHVAL